MVDHLRAQRPGVLDAAESFVASQGCDRLVGNFNLTAMQQIGVVTGGFEKIPYVDMQYNPPHIPRLLEAAGFAAVESRRDLAGIERCVLARR